MNKLRFPYTALFLITCLVLCMSDAEAQHIRSPEVHSDGRVTLRLKSQSADQVSADIAGQKLTLTKGEKNIWAGTTSSLKPGIYEYAFDVDGTRMIDPSNRRIKKWFSLASLVEVSGDPPLLTEFQDVPHGAVQRVIYPSKSVGHSRPVVIYTPPQYARNPDRYPIVLLLHGFGDDETAWTEVGRAHLIADNLIAAGKIRPCVIAMPYGHPLPVPYGKRPDGYFPNNADLHTQDMVQDLLPWLRQNYLTLTTRENTFVAGLSMGGGQAIDIGLKHVDQFNAIGAFSAAVPELSENELLEKYPALAGSEPPANALARFWIPIGTDDFLLKRNDRFAGQLRSIGIQSKYEKTSGGHQWKVWRRYLPQFLMQTVGTETGN